MTINAVKIAPQYTRSIATTTGNDPDVPIAFTIPKGVSVNVPTAPNPFGSPAITAWSTHMTKPFH